MPFTFNMLLEQAGVSPADVRLLRHQPTAGGKQLIDVWRNSPAEFEAYQSCQASAQRASFARAYWASFIGTWDGRTTFAGIYEVGKPAAAPAGFTSAVTGVQFEPDTYDIYPTKQLDALSEYGGRLYVDWGGGASGKRAWSQRADAQDKIVTELNIDAIERPFPGLMELVLPLSALAEAPPTWAQALERSKGVYLLTCPRDGSLYVGSATAEGGFWSRWSAYLANGHGGNVALIGREPSDYIVSVLEVAGSAANADDILALEGIWKRKLNSRAIGLNLN